VIRASNVGEVAAPASLLAAKVDVLQGIVKDLHRRERLHGEELAVMNKQHLEEMSIRGDEHMTTKHEAEQLKTELCRLREEQHLHGDKCAQLMSKIGMLSGTVDELNAQLDRMRIEIEGANRIIAAERRRRVETDESCSQRLVDLQTEFTKEHEQTKRELEMERERSARYHLDVSRLTKRVERELLKREEREEIAGAAVEASGRRVKLLEGSLISSEKKISRQQAQIKLQQLLIRGLLQQGV